MHIRQSILISADAEAVWRCLADPVLHAEWNPKLVSIDRQRSGPVRLGERYEVLYRVSSGHEELHGVEVRTLLQPSRIVFLHGPSKNERMRGAQGIEETYELSPQKGGVKVVETIDLTRAGIPWPLRVLLWFFMRFGQDAEEPALKRLKRVVEASFAAAGEAVRDS